ncbi:esterase [Listeria monocytogenes]|uniref:esterase n=1 Tax=Listeria monocytogenes TaxID=1639 RepID=UPI0011EA81EF|nr:esterase [Listeria monocytogenes]EKZ4975722.1 esterase [Listeria monocytogenes]TYV20565.1 esterase [Listeria monocytogenes]
MIQVENEQIAGIPVLHISNSENADKMLPTIIFYHGFTSQKELYLHYGYLLSQRGFRVILPDAKLHGERLQGANPEDQATFFWDVIETNITEFPLITDELIKAGKTDANRIGVGGVSMGAITSLGLLGLYENIKVAVSLMGSAYYVDFAKELSKYALAQGLTFPFDVDERILALQKYDLTQNITKINNRPLLLWHGKKDDVVPFAYSEKLYQTLVEESLADNVQFIIDDNAKHKVSVEGMLQGVSFFEKFL